MVLGSCALVLFGVGCTHVEATEISVAEGPRATAPQTQTAHAAPIPAISQDSQDDLQGASRPRLSRTLRLGVDTPAYESGAGNGGPARGRESNGVTVVVNNNITQQQTAVGSLGGYGNGFGRGGYGAGNGGYSYGQRTPSSVTPVPQQAPQTVPPVGGDWARPTNYGPPAMR
jgi:hypothetical protein